MTHSHTDVSAVSEALCNAALRLAAARGWGPLTVMEIAAEADVAPSDLYGVFADKLDIADALAARFDRLAAGELDLDVNADARERAFDAAMARFDAMEPHRAGLVPMIRDVSRDPLAAMKAWRWGVRSARWLLELARFDASGVKGAARTRVFAVVLARATQAWLKDEAGDLSRTMAALDRDLRDLQDFARRSPFSRNDTAKAHKTDQAADTAPLGPDAERDA